MDVPLPTQYEGYEEQENYQEDENFTGRTLCDLRSALFVLARYALYGAVTAFIVHIVPTYGSAISEAELVVIAAVVAGIILIGEKVIPDSSFFALR